MGDPVRPPSGDARVCAAVALGWQMAALYHSPVRRGPACDPPRGDRLPGRSDFSPATRSKWLGEQIAATTAYLLPAPSPDLQAALGTAAASLAAEDRSREATREHVFVLHCRLLEALTVADFRLGKAYGLGRAVAETALVPASVEAGQADGVFRDLLGTGRVATVKNWLVELKSMLPGHTAYAVSRGLDEWCQWAGQPRPADGWQAAQPVIRTQGYVWRELLTGEKAARDILSVSGYLDAALQIARRAVIGTWWLILAMILAAAGVVTAVILVPGLSATAQVAASLAWVGATIAAGLKATGAFLGVAVSDAQGWLWQAELDESVALAATRIPPPAKGRRRTGLAVGQMSLSADETGALSGEHRLRPGPGCQPGGTVCESDIQRAEGRERYFVPGLKTGISAP